MSAQDYAINFPYGATSAPYSPAHPHRGNDRACPTGTPIVINGTTIGLTGATGKVTGAHLHIQEWSGNYANTRRPQNEFKPGVVIGVYPNSAGDGTFGKFIDIRNDDGWVDSYCHLSAINVQVGQRVGVEMANMVDRGGVDTVWKLALDRAPTEAEYARWVGKDWAPMIFWAYTSQDYKDRYAGLVKNWEVSTKEAPELRKQVAELGRAVDIKQKEIESLKAQVGDNSKWETFKALVRELVGKA